MSLAVAVPCGVLSGIAYGIATAVQHQAVHATAPSGGRGLLAVVRNPRWLASIGGDAIGLVLQIVALSTGPVVLIQPLFVLAIPVALPVGWLLGGPRPRPLDYLACAAIVVGLAAFFAVLGDPGRAGPLGTRPAVLTPLIALLAGGLICLAVRGRSPGVRAGVFGAVSGAWFGLVGVLLNAAADVWRVGGGHGLLATTHGWVTVGAVVLLGGVAIGLTQVAFQTGPLAASFPANESTAPLVAVLLGGLLLHEHVPASAGAVIVYAISFVVVLGGAVWLAREH